MEWEAGGLTRHISISSAVEATPKAERWLQHHHSLQKPEAARMVGGGGELFHNLPVPSSSALFFYFHKRKEGGEKNWAGGGLGRQRVDGERLCCNTIPSQKPKAVGAKRRRKKSPSPIFFIFFFLFFLKIGWVLINRRHPIGRGGRRKIGFGGGVMLFILTQLN
jgi:hypothetical protein